MSTEFINNQWRLPNAWNGSESNVNKQSNYSMDFDGANNDHIETSSNVGISGSQSRSMSVWLKGGSANNGKNWPMAVAFGQGSTNKAMWIGGGGSPSAYWYFGWWGAPSATSGDLATTIRMDADNDWHLLTSTYDGTTAKGYIDGVEVISAARTINTTDSTLKIGEHLNGSVYWDGQIDAVSIFDYALSSSQITTLYGSSSTGIGNPMSLSPKPVAYYPLGDQDAFNGANYLVPNIAAQEDDGDIATSYSPYALDFDGTNDYIEIPDSSDLQLVNTDFSISFWINPSAGGSYIFMDKYGSGTGWGFYLQSGNLRFLAYPSGFQTVTTVSQNVWTHILIVGDNSGDNLLCYKNGAEVYNSSYTLSISSNTTNLIIGSENGNNFYYNGLLSNVSIWNTALTSTQVTELYNEGVPSNLNNHSAYSNLVSWWQLGSNSSFNTNWTVLDEKGSNNGTSSNMTEDAIVDGVGSYANGLSSGMGGDEVIGSAPFSDANSLSYNMDVLDRSTDVPN